MEDEINFQKFLGEITDEINVYEKEKREQDETKCVFNKLKDKERNEAFKSNKVFIAEINEINVKTLREVISKEMINDKYPEVLFRKILKKSKKSKERVLTEKSNFLFIEYKEKYETIKRIISRYFEFFLHQNFINTINGFNSFTPLLFQVTKCYEKINNTRKKLNTFKKYYIDLSSKITLKKEKMKNLQSILINLKSYNEWYLKYNSLSKKVNKTEAYYVQSTFEQKTHLSYSQISKLIEQICKSKSSQKSIYAFLLVQNLKDTQKYYLDNYEEDLRSIFFKKLSEIELINLFDMFICIKASNPDNKELAKNEFFSFLIFSHKKNIFRIIKGAYLSYVDITNISLSSNDITKLSHIKALNLKFEESKLFLLFHQIGKSFAFICDILNHYSNLNVELCFVFKENRTLFCDILIKKLVKFIDILIEQICFCIVRKWSYSIIACLYILQAIILKTLELDSVPLLEQKLNSLVKLLALEDLKKKIENICVFLNADHWKRCSINKIEE